MARWRVVSDLPRDELTRDGTFTAVREIRFEVLDNAREGTVVIPLRLYTPEYVSTEIQAYADRIAAIGDLTGG
jgi:hypothetical protein